MNTVVTGASGFTGYNLCRRLLQDGHSVTAFVRSSSRVDALLELGVECRTVCLWDEADVTRNMAGADVVFHIAAAYRQEHADVAEFDRVNVEGTRALLKAAQRLQVSRFVHCSTVGVQGQIDHPPAAEDYRVQPGDHYQESKLKGELLALEYAASGLPVTVVRPVGIYGPGDTRFLKLFRSVKRGRFVMIGSGNTLYHLTYVDDLIEGFILASREPQAIGEVITVAGERYTTLNELVALIASAVGTRTPKLKVPYALVNIAAIACEYTCRPLGISPPLYRRRVEFFSKDRAFDISKARRLLGYRPAVDLTDGLARTAAWYEAEGLL